MADETGISWTDHTFNPWWGCSKIAPGCENCYAAALDKRTGGDYWNPKTDPRRTRIQNWKKVIQWNEQAEIENRRHRVFCGSMMDWCDKNAPPGALESLWQLISKTPMLDWQLLTKRATRIAECLPVDWYDGYENVWLGVTVENKEFGIPRIKELQKIPAKVRFLSAEPLLESLGEFPLDGIRWVIIGGESGPGFRPFNKKWAEEIISQCDEKDISVWFKQHGGNSRDKGGCLINGIELKQWPEVAA